MPLTAGSQQKDYHALTGSEPDADWWISPQDANEGTPGNAVIATQLSDLYRSAYKAATEKTVSSGVLTVDQNSHTVQPETGTSDVITTISGMKADTFLVLYMTDEGTDTGTFEHGTGNLSCFGAADVALSHGMVVCYYDGTVVYVAGGGGGVQTSENYWGGNLIKNYPSLELANGAQPDWWKKTNDPILTEEDATGESIPQKYERVLKLVISADGGGVDYAYQDFDDADEPTLDDNITIVSTGCWIYTASAGTITLELYDVDGTASLGTTTTATTGSWVWLEVLNKTYQDSMRWRLTHSANNATVYIAMPSLNIGATVRPWKSRGFIFREIAVANLVNADPGGGGFTDLDLSGNTSTLTFMVQMICRYKNTTTERKSIFVRRNGDANTDGRVVATNPNLSTRTNTVFIVPTDDSQIVEYDSDADVGDTESLIFDLNMLWEWA